VIIACDGVSEGDFPNQEVVKLIAQELGQGAGFAGGPGDAGAAAEKVILKAEKQNSKDNITCMIIQFNGISETITESIEFNPGPIEKDGKFLSAYEVMAKRAGFTMPEALEKRYNVVCKQLAEAGDDDTKGLRAERALLIEPSWNKDEFVVVDGENPQMSPAYFAKLAETMTPGEGDMGAGVTPDMMRLLSGMGLLQGGPKENRRRCRLADLDPLKSAVEEHSALHWEDKMAQVAGSEAEVKQVDPSDGTVQVHCKEAGIEAWVPESCITYLDGEGSGAATGGGYAGGGSAPATSAT